MESKDGERSNNPFLSMTGASKPQEETVETVEAVKQEEAVEQAQDTQKDE